MKEYSDGQGGRFTTKHFTRGCFLEGNTHSFNFEVSGKPEECYMCGWGKEIVKCECWHNENTKNGDIPALMPYCDKCNPNIQTQVKSVNKTDREYLEELIKLVNEPSPCLDSDAVLNILEQWKKENERITTFTEVSLRENLIRACTGKEPNKDGLFDGDLWLKDMENFWHWSSLANKWYPLCINGKKIQYPDTEISLVGLQEEHNE